MRKEVSLALALAGLDEDLLDGALAHAHVVHHRRQPLQALRVLALELHRLLVVLALDQLEDRPHLLHLHHGYIENDGRS